MPDDAPPDEQTDDFELFRQQMKDVTPLRTAKRIAPARPARRARRMQQEVRHEPGGYATAGVDDAAPEVLNFSRSGIQNSTLKKLRQGRLPIEQRIDLHGLTAEQARNYFIDFIDECRQDNVRCALIVHGKGYRSRNNIAVIKSHLNRWLRECPQVLAFHSAQTRDGGTGAVYILLKQARQAR